MRLWQFIAITVLAVASPSCGRIEFGPNASWDFKTGELSWWSGTVRLPPGWTYRERNEGDTFSGAFDSPNGGSWIVFDIGYYAGLWATPGDWLHEERIVGGVRVWTAQKLPDGDPQTPNLYAVSFPDSDYANFYIQAEDIEGAAPIWYIARSFRPKGPVRRVQWP